MVSGVTVPSGVESVLAADEGVDVAVAPTEKAGVVSTVDRDYKFEEMFIEHPDLFTLSNKIKELVSLVFPLESNHQPI